MHNNRNNGYPFYQQASPSLHNQQKHVFGETEWSSRDETWRGSGSIPALRNDSWKVPSSAPREEFQFGRDRAPSNISDQFLGSIGAKRLNNGNLVDRNGYTLRVRDPECRAPSPPSYNPGRELRKAGTPKSFPKVDQLSQDELDKKARMQIQMMRNQEKHENRHRHLSEPYGRKYVHPGPEKNLRTAENSNPPIKRPQNEQNWNNSYRNAGPARKELYSNPNHQNAFPALLPSPPNFFFPSPRTGPPPGGQLPAMSKPKKAPLLPNPPGFQTLPPPAPVSNYPFGAPVPAKTQNDVSSDSEEDEAIAKLRAIVQNHGKH